MNLTTQKVSHPPVRPKYGAFPPARACLNTAMARWVVYINLRRGKRRERTEQDNEHDLMKCRRTSLFEGGVPKQQLSGQLMPLNLSYPTADLGASPCRAAEHGHEV